MGRTAIRLAWPRQRKPSCQIDDTYVFDIRARVNSDDVAMLNTKVMPHNTVDTSASIIKIIIGQHNQKGVLPLLALHQNCITTEKLEGIHSIVGEGNNGVIIVNGIGDAIVG